MTPEQWEQVGKIFDAATALRPEERSYYLDQACNGDESLRREVESLLRVEGQAGGFLSSPAMEDAAKLLSKEEPGFSAGTRLGSYEVLEFVESGGMGEVYKARHVTLKNLVALKFLPTAVAHDADRLRRFKQEARAASALNHPNIITVHDFIEAPHGNFIVTEYVEGETLRQRLKRGRMDLNETIDVASQVANGLAAAHAVGVIHRDIKPENIMLRRDGYVKVLDFGIAKLSDRADIDLSTTAAAKLKTDTGVVMGTSRYMSPEQARGLPVDARSDVWSLGVVLYEMLCGRAPFEGETNSDVLASILDREPPPLASLAPKVQRIVRKTLAKDREERYQTAQDLLSALKSLKQSPPKLDLSKFFWPAAVLVCFLFIALIALYFSRHTSDTSPVTGTPLTASPLTSDPGFEGMPSLSPDGNYVAFIAGGGEGERDFDLYVKQIGGGPPLRLTTGPAVEEFPAWSPDGRSIAFVRTKGDKLDVLLISPLGGPERKLAEITADSTTSVFSWVPPYLSWSPDSKYLVMMDRLSSGEPYGLFILSVATGEKRRLTTPPATALADANPAISPDGHTLAFVREEFQGTTQLYVLPLAENYGAAGNTRRLEIPQVWVTSPAWTADGREIVCATSGDSWGDTGLWRVHVSGSEKAQPLVFGENGSQPTISQHGNRLVYADWKADYDIWRVELSGAGKNSSAVKLISSTRSDTQADYSPDGSRITFISDRSGHTEVWMCNSDGSSPVQLTSMEGTAGSPRWFPDGRRIIFDFHKEGQWDTYEIDTDSRVPQRLTNGPQDNNTPSVSHNGQWIYFSSRRTGSYEIWRMPAAGGEATQLTHKGGTRPIESADGEVVYYAKAFGALTEIWQIPATGGNETRVLGPVGAFRFAVVANGIYFIEIGARLYVGSRGNSLKFYRLATGSTEKVADIKLNATVGLSISSDGRYALMTLIDPFVCDLKLVENFR